MNKNNNNIITTELRSEHDVMLTRQRARQLADLLGFDMQDQTRIATAVSEIARNAVQHAGGGKVAFQLAGGSPQTLWIHVTDTGPGIADLTGILEPDGCAPNERGESVRGVRRLVDEFEVKSDPAGGTRVTLGKRCSRFAPLVDQKGILRITGLLMDRLSEDPLAEMQRQNQELLHTLDELRSKQDEATRHLDEIKSLNARLELSMQASHHRVKNSLQTISALVDVQLAGDETAVPVAVVQRIGQHARALATLHDMLTHKTRNEGDSDIVSAKDALNRLIPPLEATTGGRRIIYVVDEFSLSVQKTASLALLISELISNAVKHGTNDIELKLAVDGNIARLEVRNDGSGFPPGFDWRKSANTGLAIIDSTGRHDLGGTIRFQNEPAGGANVVVTFPIAMQDELQFNLPPPEITRVTLSGVVG